MILCKYFEKMNSPQCPSGSSGHYTSYAIEGQRHCAAPGLHRPRCRTRVRHGYWGSALLYIAILEQHLERELKFSRSVGLTGNYAKR